MEISESGRFLLGDLFHRGWWSSLVGSQDRQLVALAGLARLAEPATAGAIAVALVEADDRVLAAGHRLLRKILESLDAAGVRTLIAHAPTWVTEIPPESWERWWKLSTADVPRIVSGQDGVAFLALVSGHHSGYVREEAVRQISGATDASRCRVIDLSAEYLALGHDEIEAALVEIGRRTEANDWDDHPDAEVLEPPRWMAKRIGVEAA